MKNYWPSKKFLIFMLIMIGGALTFFIINQIMTSKQKFVSDQQIFSQKEVGLEDLFEKDSDGDGLKDWEEILRGTDPQKAITFDLPDAEWVKNRQRELKLVNEIKIDDSSDENQTKRFSQELLATLAALKASGNLDQNTIIDLSNFLGQQMFEGELPDNFKEGDVLIGNVNQADYFLKIVEILESAASLGAGNELTVVSEMLAKEDYRYSEELLNIAESYKNLALDLQKITAPTALGSFHLNLLNSGYKVSQSVATLAKMLDDPMVGMVGLVKYQKYNEDFLKELENKLVQN